MTQNFLERINKARVVENFKVAFTQGLRTDLIGNGFVVKDNVVQKIFFVTLAPNLETFGNGRRTAIKFFAARNACRLKSQFPVVKVGRVKHEPLTTLLLLPIGK